MSVILIIIRPILIRMFDGSVGHLLSHPHVLHGPLYTERAGRFYIYADHIGAVFQHPIRTLSHNHAGFRIRQILNDLFLIGKKGII